MLLQQLVVVCSVMRDSARFALVYKPALLISIMLSFGTVALAQAELQLPDRLAIVSPRVYRGARPTPEHLANLQKYYGVKTILNIEGDDAVVADERASAERLGLKFISVPIGSFNRPRDADVDKILIALLNAEKQGTVYIHCRHGRDRTGLMVAMYRVFYQGWKRDAAWAEAKRLGFRTILFPLSNYFWWRTGGYP